MIKRFKNNDLEYENWLERYQSGFVFNFFGGKEGSSKDNRIHRASCYHLKRPQDKGKRTTRYEKVCSNMQSELEDFVNQERGNSWSYCSVCFKNGE